MLESEIQKRILQFLKKEGCFAYKHIATNINGIPDIFFIHPNGYGVFIEVKNEKGKPTLLQKFQIDRINKSPAKYLIARVCNSFGDFKNLYDNLKNNEDFTYNDLMNI